MISEKKPEIFNPKFDVVSCYIECDGELLLLHRQDNKPEGNTWGVPAGKVDLGEEPIDAIIREVKQETGLAIPKDKITYLDRLFVKFPKYDFVYYLYQTKLDKKQKITIHSLEHKDFKWISPKDALKLNLMEDEDYCIKKVFKL